jgi:L-threonylcarbamoyladenylate synthase
MDSEMRDRAREAVRRIRRIKGKAEPILVLVSGEEMAGRYVEVDGRARKLMNSFWPGPLTLILKSSPEF